MAIRRQLTAYTFDGGDGQSLFVPFLDATSGTETYGAGRYLDLEPEDDLSYELDFNLAYHPSCVYDPVYSCPLTPAENRLPIRIEAGERLRRGVISSPRQGSARPRILDQVVRLLRLGVSVSPTIGSIALMSSHGLPTSRAFSFLM